MLWEIWSRKIPWAGLKHTVIGFQVVCKRQRLPVPDGTPTDLAELTRRCWAHDPAERPSFKEIALQLQATTPRQAFASPRDSLGFGSFMSRGSSVAQGTTKSLTSWAETADETNL